jgi:16S rRNA (adenine1518-N6/adenine1519-N6)-dimethyltransferase
MKQGLVKAKKKFGQNFLKDVSVLTKIIESMPKSERKIVEIGPGLGDLTKYLVNVKSVTAFEVDTDLCSLLQGKFKNEINTKRLELRCGDVLEAWKSELYDEAYDLVANLPYYIATNIILKALADTHCHNILVMVQLEVAQKFCAKPGEKAFGSLAVIAQSVATCSITQVVPPSAFDPEPKVDSAVMLLQKHTSRSDEGFEQFLKSCFTQPRKTLLKNLSSAYDKKQLEEAFNTLGLALNIRPHQLATNDYHQLYKIIQESLDGRRKKRH